MDDDADLTTWEAVGALRGYGSITHALIYSDKPRTWRERLFSWPWRPWDKYRGPIAVIDLTEPER